MPCGCCARIPEWDTPLTRGSLVQMGDVSAKDGSQETLVNLAAVLVGMVLLPLINENVFYTWLLFVTATICHIYCNYRAVTCLVLEQFNYEVYRLSTLSLSVLVDSNVFTVPPQRLRIATCQYIESGTVPSPAEMSVLEPILWFGSRFVSLTVGDRFGESFYSATEFKLAQVATKYAPGTKNYLLTYKPDNFFTPTSLNLMCVLHEHAETDDILRAHFHGLLVGHVFDNVKAEKERTGDLDVLFKNARELLGSKPHSGHGWGRVMKSSAGMSHWPHTGHTLIRHLSLLCRNTNRLLREQLQELCGGVQSGRLELRSCTAHRGAVPLAVERTYGSSRLNYGVLLVYLL